MTEKQKKKLKELNRKKRELQEEFEDCKAEARILLPLQLRIASSKFELDKVKKQIKKMKNDS